NLQNRKTGTRPALSLSTKRTTERDATMANYNLFNTREAQLPASNTLNQAQAPAYAYQPKHKLAQLAVSGCLNQTFYATAETQLSEVLKLVAELDARYVAKAAIYARKKGHMKD